VIFDQATAKKAMRDEVTLTLRLHRPKVARAQLIPLSTKDGMIGRLHVRCIWRTSVGGPWEQPWGIEDPERSVGKLGFPSMDGFRRAWIEANDPGWVARGFVDEGAWFERFQSRWRDRACWAVAFEVARDVPLLLAPSGSPPRRSKGLGGVETLEDSGYVSSPFLALPDEPEAVDPDTIEPAWSQLAAARLADSRSEEQQRRQLRALSGELKRVPVDRDQSPHIVELRRVLDAMKEDRAA
jgi:hypothetical protein